MIALLLLACGANPQPPAPPSLLLDGLHGRLGADQHTPPGNILLQVVHPDASVAVVFEDNGRSGMFYALELTRSKHRIRDALQVWSNASLPQPSRARRLTVLWAPLGHRGALLVDAELQAVFDFDTRRGWSLSGEPQVVGAWGSPEGHAWDEQAARAGF